MNSYRLPLALAFGAVLSCGASLFAASTTPLFTPPAAASNQVPTAASNQLPAVVHEPAPAPTPAPPSHPDLVSAFSCCQAGRYGIAARTLKAPSCTSTSSPPHAWQRSLGFGMDMARGNSDTLRYTLGLNASREGEADLTQFKAQGVYGESDHVKDTENADVAARYGRDLTPRCYGLGTLDWFSDTVADLNYRLTGILSPGYRLIRSDTAILNVEAGAGYLEEDKGGDRKGFAAGRLAAAFEELLNPHVLVWCSGEYLPKFSSPETFFANGEAGLASALANNLTLNLVLRDRRDSDPVPGKKEDDVTFTTSLVIAF